MTLYSSLSNQVTRRLHLKYNFLTCIKTISKIVIYIYTVVGHDLVPKMVDVNIDLVISPEVF